MKVTLVLLPERLKYIKVEFPEAIATPNKSDPKIINVEIEIKDSMDALALFHSGLTCGWGTKLISG